jgi:hypothetical protein
MPLAVVAGHVIACTHFGDTQETPPFHFRENEFGLASGRLVAHHACVYQTFAVTSFIGHCCQLFAVVSVLLVMAYWMKIRSISTWFALLAKPLFQN